MSNTPLFNAAQSMLRHEKTSFHTPGHKGKIDGSVSLFNVVSRYDLTEIPGMDSLYEPSGAILEVEKNISRVYRSKRSLISCGGATLGIQTMLALALKPRDKLLASRNAHVSLINALTLLNVSPVWIAPEKNAGEFLPGRVTKQQVEDALKADKDIKAVYITSPDYYGVISDIKGISEICRKYNAVLLVDNAHGAHLSIVSNEAHPMDLGADMCVDSAHKTMPVLTGGAFLHINNEKYIKNAKSTMALFGSTSPSYLIMLTIDNCIGEILDGGSIKYIRFTQEMLSYQEKLKNEGFKMPVGIFDVSRFCLSADIFGYTGKELYWWLRSADIEPEMYSDRFVVLIPSIRTQEDDILKLLDALKELPKMDPLDNIAEPRFTIPKKIMEPTEAFFKDSEIISVDKAINRVAAESKSVCPPGMPVVIAGELINKQAVESLKLSGIFFIKVVI